MTKRSGHRGNGEIPEHPSYLRRTTADNPGELDRRTQMSCCQRSCFPDQRRTMSGHDIADAAGELLQPSYCRAGSLAEILEHALTGTPAGRPGREISHTHADPARRTGGM